MTTELLFVNYSCKWKKFVDTGEEFPDGGVSVFPKTLVVEAKRAVDLSAFVASSKEPDLAGVAGLECQQQCEDSHRVEASVDVVPQEEVVDELMSAGYWALPGDAKDLAQVCELAVHVADQHDRTFQVQYCFFAGQGGLRLLALGYSLDDHRDLRLARLEPAFL